MGEKSSYLLSIKFQLSPKAKAEKIKWGASTRDVYRGGWGAQGSILGSFPHIFPVAYANTIEDNMRSVA